MTPDNELLARYVADGSQPAFAELVARHVNMVYASARRQMDNADAAEDIVQAVFLMLARRASSLRRDVVLPGWLMTATWYACKNALRQQRRRRIHEARAAEMRTEMDDSGPSSVPRDDNPNLDEALARLGETDRAAVTMRFLQERSVEDVAVALGVSEQAARKRVTRAVDKLRDQFRRRGVALEWNALAEKLGHEAQVVAPAALPMLVASAVTNSMTGAAGGVSAAGVALADATAKTMSAAAGAKLAAVVVMSVLALASVGAAVYAATSARRAPTDPPAAVVGVDLGLAPLAIAEANSAEPAPSRDRVDFANQQIGPIGQVTEFASALPGAAPVGKVGQYEFGEDANVKRQAHREAAVYIASPGPALLPGMRGRSLPALGWNGKRVEVSVYLRTQDVSQATGLNVLIFGDQNMYLAGDIDGGSLRIAGTNDWMRMASVLDVPADAQRIELGLVLWGSGRVWLDSCAIQSVPDTVPLTSDAQWHLTTQFPLKVRLANDAAQLREGHGTVRVASVATPREWGKLMRVERDLDAIRGKRIRVKAMVKSQNVNAAGVFINAGHFGEARQYVQKESKHHLPITGTRDWTPYAATLDVLAEADMLEYGIRFEGAGTAWIDDVRVEVLP